MLCASQAVSAQTSYSIEYPFETWVTLSDPCAVFNIEKDPGIVSIAYGEPIDLYLQGTVQAVYETNYDNKVSLKFMIKAHGSGFGWYSGIKYQFNSKMLAKISSSISPFDPNFAYNGKFRVDARIMGQGNDGSSGGIAQGAQDNALLHFYLTVRYAKGAMQTFASDFTIECAASPWTNQMTNPIAGTKQPVGRGFGDTWNKYTWSMKDFKGGMIVGTKNAYYDVLQVLDPNDQIGTCMSSGSIPYLYAPLACLELFGGGNYASTSYAEIWRFDYSKKSWTRVRDDQESQGFRVMEVHNNVLYAGSDLGSAVMGVSLFSDSPSTYDWFFPGSKLLKSTDGINFVEVSCPSELCNSGNGMSSGEVNTSIRSLASYKGKLYLGTFRSAGAQLWSYDDLTGDWELVMDFGPTKPAITELKVYMGKLYIGFGAGSNSEYLWVYDPDVLTFPNAVVGQPEMTSGSNLGVLKLFVSTKGLYIGLVDLQIGFTLLKYNGSGFETITSNGFCNEYNAYAWSMAEINGRLFVGTFNRDFLAELPRGSAELWYSDDGYNWQQMALPLNWGVWNYGIRTMEIGNKQLFLGTASNLVAPDFTFFPEAPGTPISPGTEIWTIKATTVAPSGKGGK